MQRSKIFPNVLLCIILALLVSACQSASIPTVNGHSGENGLLSPADLQEANNVAIYTEEGDIIYADSSNVQLNGNTLAVNRERYKDVIGVILDPPALFVGDAYNLAAEALENDIQVMLIYVDGLGWDSYQRALSSGIIHHLADYDVQKAMSVFPTITPVNYAAMVSGQTPLYTGIKQRSDHNPICESIFDLATKLGKTSCIVEGDKQILQFSIDQRLHPDLDGDGGTDNEVFDTALAAIAEGHDLLFVHFHGLDDISHAHGPKSPEAVNKLIELDNKIANLAANWPGAIVIASDHGQHDDGKGKGVHGEFRAEDILTPLFTRP